MASASIGDPQSLNLFAYVGNNPVDFVDPSGLETYNCTVTEYRYGFSQTEEGAQYWYSWQCELEQSKGSGGGSGKGSSGRGGKVYQQSRKPKCPEQDFNFDEGNDGLSKNELSEIAQALVGEASTYYASGEIYAIMATMMNRLAINMTAKANPSLRLKTFNNGGVNITGEDSILSEYDAYSGNEWRNKRRKDGLRKGEGKLKDIKNANGGYIPRDSYVCNQLIEAKGHADKVSWGYKRLMILRGITYNLGTGPKDNKQRLFVGRIGDTRFYRDKNLTF